MKTGEILQMGGLAVVGVLLWKLFNKGSETADHVSTAIADLWLKLFPLPPAMELLGNVKFPGNIFVTLQSLASKGAVRRNSSGEVFVSYANLLWKLAPSNAYGNWEATAVS